MVLEQVVPDEFWHRRFSYAVIVGFVYSIISAVIARQVFSANPGIVSVMFLTLFLLPSIRKLFVEEEKREEKERVFTFRKLWQDNHHTLRVYFGIFTGVFLAYMSMTFILPQLGYDVINVVREQLFLDPALKGRAFDVGTFWGILSNNWYVLLIAFLFAIAWSDGALFFVSWNASAWGAIFGYRALTAAWQANGSPILFLLTELGYVVWHTFLEGGAYILAAISGSVISEEVVKRSDELHNFLLWACISSVGGVLLSFIARRFFATAWSTVILILGTLGLVYLLQNAFTTEDHTNVFIYNYWLFVLAIAVFVVGAIVETYVLTNATGLQEIYQLSRQYTVG